MALTGEFEPIQPIGRDKESPRTRYFVADDTTTYKKGNPAELDADGRLNISADDAAATRYVVAETTSATADVTKVPVWPLIPGQLWSGVIEGVSADSMVGDLVGFDVAGTTLTSGSVVLNGANNFFRIIGSDPRFTWGDTHAVVVLEVVDDLA
jgi:hypothetical protein